MNRKRHLRTPPIAAAMAATAVALAVSSAAAAPGTPLPAASDRPATHVTGGFTFEAKRLVRPDPSPQVFLIQDGEPEIKIDLFGNVYVTAMQGVPGGTHLWKSTDKGATFAHLGQPDGAQDKCPTPGSCVGIGGGDDQIDVSTGGYLYVSSLWLGNVTMSTSYDGGTGGVLPHQKWEVNPAAAGVPVDDRQWIAAYGPRTVFMTYRQIGTGLLFWTRSNDAGKTWAPATPITTTPAYPGVFFEGNLVVDPYSGNLYTAFIATSKNQIWVLKSTNGGTTWSAVKAYEGPPGTENAQIFPVLAVDKGGNVHLVFSRCGVSTTRSNCHIWLTSSVDQGQTWLRAVQVDSGAENASAVLPWVVAGSPGVVDVTWLGAPEASPDAAGPKNWKVFFAQTRNALAESPTFDQVQASPGIVHDKVICMSGLSCPQGTRDMLEYYTMALDPDGNANIAYPDSVNDCPAGTCITRVFYAKQTAGASAYEPPAPPPPAAFAPNYKPAPTHTGAEPNIWIDSDNCIYLAAIDSNANAVGLPVYKSNNNGTSFTLSSVSGPLLVGDADVISFPDGNPATADDVYLSSLEIADVRVMKSADGTAFTQVPPPGNVSNPSSDRMWFAADKIGSDQILYQVDHELASEIIRVFKSVNDGAWQGFNTMTDPDLTSRTLPNTNTGNIWVDKRNHNVYAVFPSSTNTTNAMSPPFGKQLEIWMSISTGNTTSTNAGTVWVNFPVLMSVVDSPAGIPTNARTYGVKAGNIFAAGDVDSVGNLYVTWVMNSSRTNQFEVWFSSSGDAGRTWYGPHKVSQGVGTSVMPWIAAGDSGRVSIAWYGTSTVGDPNTLPISAQWHVYFAQSLNARDREPVFTQVQASDHVMHVGPISTGGLIGSSDRSLLDFFEIALDRGGFTHMVYADNGTAGPVDARLSYTKQIAGPRAYTNPTFPTCPGGPTAVKVSSLGATRAAPRAVRVEWEAASEATTLGFNVWRSRTRDSGYRKLNRALIGAKTVLSLGGNRYRYVDRAAAASSRPYYKLEIVSLNGRRDWAGPVRVTAARASAAHAPPVTPSRRGHAAFRTPPLFASGALWWIPYASARSGAS